MLTSYQIFSYDNLPLMVVIISLSLIIIYLIYRYETGEKKHLRVRESERQEEFECPRCGTFVDSDVSTCPECNAEFETDIFSCPVCGTTVSEDHQECPECSESFIFEEPEFKCPECNANVDQFATECEECGAEFWSPVKEGSMGDEDEDEEDNKLESHKIEIIDE